MKLVDFKMQEKYVREFNDLMERHHLVMKWIHDNIHSDNYSSSLDEALDTVLASIDEDISLVVRCGLIQVN